MSRPAYRCDTCGRRYTNPDDLYAHRDPDLTGRILTATTCEEGISGTDGTYQPCDRPAVAWRIDERDDTAYPVCPKHTRQPMIPIQTVLDATAAENRD